jgi:hypothetical protein
VDTNRNWDFHWNEGGSSSNTCAEDYMGPKPFSEPEETALALYIKSRNNVLGYIDFHSYSQLWMTVRALYHCSLIVESPSLISPPVAYLCGRSSQPWGYTNTLPKNYPDLLAATKRTEPAASRELARVCGIRSNRRSSLISARW